MSRQLSMGLVINGVLKSFNLGCRSSMGGGANCYYNFATKPNKVGKRDYHQV